MTNVSDEALKNKKRLVNQFFKIIVSNKEYDFKIDKISNKEIFIQKKFYYEELVSVDSKDSFEFYIQNLITESDDFIDNPMELKQRSINNKNKLMRRMFSIPIGDKKNGFRIINITSRHIKIENVLSFELIEKIYAKNIISLEYLLHELLLGNMVDYDLFKESDSRSYTKDTSTKTKISEGSQDIPVDVTNINKLSSEELTSKLSNVKGWQKLVFDSIDNYEEDVFTLDKIEKQDIYDSYRFQGESLIPTIESNLSPLIDLGLVKKFDEKHYVKLW